MGYKINDLAPMRYLVESNDASGPIDRAALGKLVSVETKSPTFEIELPAAADTGHETLKVSLGYYYCQTGAEGVCKAGSVVFSLPVTLSPGAPESMHNYRSKCGNSFAARGNRGGEMPGDEFLASVR